MVENQETSLIPLILRSCTSLSLAYGLIASFASELRCFEFCFQGNDDLIIVHEALNFGDCHLSLAVPSFLELSL